MSYFVNAQSIRMWAGRTDARSMLPHVIRRLALATIDQRHIQKIDFPAYESGQRSGFDGEVICTEGNAWIPTGHSVWELSVDASVGSKAASDFEKRTEKSAAEFRSAATYVSLTAQHWEKKKEWEQEHRCLGQWKNVHAYDADDIEQWMETAPGVAVWFAGRIGNRPEGVDDVVERWCGIAGSATRPLTPQVFLVSRAGTQNRVHDWLCGDPRELEIESRSPTEVIDFFCAALQVMDEAERSAYVSRSVIIATLPAWRILRDNLSPAILVVEPTVELSAEEIGRAVTRGHHVLLAIEPRPLQATSDLLLERPSEFDLAQALETCGYSPVEAEQYARASGGSLAILKRRLARAGSRNTTRWGEIASQPAIVSALLLGAWDAGNEADRALIERIAGRPYPELESDFQRLATCRDPMLLHAARNWRVLSKDEAWSVLGDRVTPSNLESFSVAAVEVLADDDPRYELPEEERPYAQIKGHLPRFSQTLKGHVAQTVAFLGAFGDKLEAATNINIPASMHRVVRDVLPAASTWHRWASIGSRLPLLAEASPQSFLQSVREDLNRAEPEIVKLFHDEGDPLFRSCKHAGLLWALETLAWSPQYLPEVCRILLRLAEHDPGGQWGNRPDASLCEVLCHWMPHTTASVDVRIQLVDMLIHDRFEIAWRILLKLLPHPTGGVSMPTHRPMWRDWANSWRRGATRGESLKFINAVGIRIIQQAGTDPQRWKQVYENLGELPYTVHEQLIAAMERLSESELSDVDRRLVSDELSEQINRHRHFQNANWSLPAEILDALESRLNHLRPRNCVLQHAWLFDQRPDRFYQRTTGNYQENEQALEKARDEAVVEIIHTLGFDGVQSLIAHADAPAVVGAVVARLSTDQFIADVIPRQISRDNASLAFAGGFIWVRFHAEGWSWVDAVISRCATDDERAWVLAALPFETETWNRAEAAGDIVRRLYWQRCRAWNTTLGDTDVQSAIERLVECDRAGDAIDLIVMALHCKREINTQTLLTPLEALLELNAEAASCQIQRAGPHDIGEVIEALQERADVDRAQLIRLEWNFLGLLDKHSGRGPKLLHRHLSESPEFFVEVLSLLYRSKDEAPSAELATTSADEQRVAMATQACRLLHGWRLLPGTKGEGPVEEDVLRNWCSEARRLAEECGRSDVCDDHLGQLFANAPSDADGKWPCAPVRRVVETIATDSLRSGFRRGILNSRGAVWRGKGGNQERELATKYRNQASEIRFDSPFIADVLDWVAQYYEREAREWDERDRWEE